MWGHMQSNILGDVEHSGGEYVASQSLTVALPDNIVRSPSMSVASKDFHSLLRWLGEIVKNAEKSLPWRDTIWWSLPAW